MAGGGSGGAAMTEGRIAELIRPYLPEMQVAVDEGLTGGIDVPEELTAKLKVYLESLLLWNERTNLTAIRAPEAVVTRHFGEGLHASWRVPAGVETVLDLGSGAGFPGIPMKLLRPGLVVTLAESHGKKAAFLREITRTLDLQIEVHGGRAEEMVGKRRFDLVALRAVDKPERAFRTACELSDRVMVLTTGREFAKLGARAAQEFEVPGSELGRIFLCDSGRQGVSRGTSR